MDQKRWLLLGLTVMSLWGLLSIGCSHPPKRYPLQGQVLSRNTSTSEVTVTHSAIPGFMPAMTANFHLNDAGMLQQLQPGDKISGDLVVSGDGTNSWLENVRIVDQQSQGARLYHDNCAECHDNPQPDLHKQPPNLHGLFAKSALPSGAPANDEQVRKEIVEGIGTMPAFDQRLTDRDVDRLVKYLRGLH